MPSGAGAQRVRQGWVRARATILLARHLHGVRAAIRLGRVGTDPARSARAPAPCKPRASSPLRSAGIHLAPCKPRARSGCELSFTVLDFPTCRISPHVAFSDMWGFPTVGVAAPVAV